MNTFKCPGCGEFFDHLNASYAEMVTGVCSVLDEYGYCEDMEVHDSYGFQITEYSCPGCGYTIPVIGDFLEFDDEEEEEEDNDEGYGNIGEEDDV